MSSNVISSHVISGVDAPRAVQSPPAQDGQLSEVARMRQEVALERERRRGAEASALAAEARALAAEERAAVAEERAAVAEWLVGLLRGELMSDEQPQRPWSRWLPWRRR